MLLSLLDLAAVLLIGVVTALAASSMSGSVPEQFAKLGERLGMSDVSPTTLTVILGLTAALLLASKSALSIYLTRKTFRFLASRQAEVSASLASRFLSQPLLDVLKRPSQETAFALTGGVVQLTIVILGQGIVVVSEATLLVVLVVGLLFVNVFVTIFAVIFFVTIAGLLQKLLANWAGSLGVAATKYDIASYASVQEAMRTYRELMVTNRRGMYVDRFRGLRQGAADVQADVQFVSFVSKYVFEVALIVGALLLAGSQLFTKDLPAALAVIAVFLVAGSRVVPSLLRLHGAVITIRTATGLATPTSQMAIELGLAGSVTQQSTAQQTPEARADFVLPDVYEGFVPSVRVTDVTLTYPGARTPALSSVSLWIPPGSSMGLVGSTGSGKSTLADVILGVIKPEKGQVSIGGEPPHDAVRRWPGAIGYVPQEVAVVDGTVRANVALGLPDDLVDDTRVWEALERANLASFLEGHREGLETVVGESGVLLSGGQLQRLGIARALYTRPRLLVLDEATSALDAETERAIGLTLSELSGEVTLIVIAHRLATIRDLHQIAFLSAGIIEAQGTFEEVVEQSEVFRRQARLLGL